MDLVQGRIPEETFAALNSLGSDMIEIILCAFLLYIFLYSMVFYVEGFFKDMVE